MAQNVEFPFFEGATGVSMKLITLGTDTVVQTSTGLTGKTNDVAWFRATDVDESLSGIHRLIGLDSGGNLGVQGFVLLAGEADAENYYSQDYGIVKWLSGPRTLTSTSAAAVSALTGDTITFVRGEANSVALTGIGDISSYAKIHFTAKYSKDDLDSEAAVQIVKMLSPSSTSLLVIDGSSPAAGETGTITIQDAAAGDITITLDPDASTNLRNFRGWYDVQIIDGSGDTYTKTSGVFEGSLDVTRLVA